MSTSATEQDGHRDGQRDTASAGVQSVDRALNILEVLARNGEAGVTEVAAELGVHKSTAFRLVATLEAHRLVEQTEDRGKYRLGVGVLRLAGATAARLDVVQEARPIAGPSAPKTAGPAGAKPAHRRTAAPRCLKPVCSCFEPNSAWCVTILQ